ncbi:MAG: nicotinate phosphoribosyltransferase [Candidatus Nanopelagicales bacterium]|jgi:nicotinate phosphoribosyltransferase|nr:nicotinate phosphoribosyltransferase [Candidatus Nanopelagicales bacterium]
MAAPASSALLTDHYEFTMLDAALQHGTAHRQCTFEVFNRRLPADRSYAVNAGTDRLLTLIERFRFDEVELAHLAEHRVVSPASIEWLAGYRFDGDIDGYPEGELFLPEVPLLMVRADFATGVLLETLVLSVLNHDVAVASAASRMWVQARGRPLIEMGSRRTHEEAAVAAARAAYLAGFASTSNVAAGHRYGVPTAGTAAHAFTLLHDSEQEAFAAQVAALGTGTTLLVDTYDTLEGVRRAVAVAGPELGAIRLDSGDLAALARGAREILDAAGAHATRIVATSDLDEYALAALANAPVDRYGVGTAVVTGSGAPAAGLVYKLVEVDGRTVAKRSSGGKSSRGGRKAAYRRLGPDGVASAEVVRVLGPGEEPVHHRADDERLLTVPLMRAGHRVHDGTLAEARARHAHAVAELPEAARALRAAGPALPVVRG